MSRYSNQRTPAPAPAVLADEGFFPAIDVTNANVSGAVYRECKCGYLGLVGVVRKLKVCGLGMLMVCEPLLYTRGLSL